MLSRYLRSKSASSGGRDKRPYLATLCDDVDEAEIWRRQIVKEIRRGVSEIQNPGLSDERTEEMNDRLNKLLRERGHWERRILYLGGVNHAARRKAGGKGTKQMGEGEEEEVFEHNGFFYFGAARELPGVRELVEGAHKLRKEQNDGSAEVNAAALRERVDETYYGFGDEEDEEIVAAEVKAEKEDQERLAKEWERDNERGIDEMWDNSYVDLIGKKAGKDVEAEVEVVMLERKKAEALEALQHEKVND